MKKITSLLVSFIWLNSLACNVLMSAIPTPTPLPATTSPPTIAPATPTPSPTSTPQTPSTPEGEMVTDSQEGYSLYIPEGYRSACNKGVCLISKNDSNFGGMIFNLVHIPASELPNLGDFTLGLLISAMLNKQAETGWFTIEDKGPPFSIKISGMEGQIIDFKGIGAKNNPIEGQIVGFSPGPEKFFWAIAWADTSSNSDNWKNLEKDMFHFILNSATFSPQPSSLQSQTPSPTTVTTTLPPSTKKPSGGSDDDNDGEGDNGGGSDGSPSGPGGN
jgi:hypothetical protein